MLDKYIRIDPTLHAILKIESARMHITMKALVESLLKPFLKGPKKKKYFS